MAYTWKSAAIFVLRQLDREATIDEIFNQITAQKLVETDGQTPRLTLQTVLYRSELNRISNGTISKPAKIAFYEKDGLWGLVEWLDGTSPAAPTPKTAVRSPAKPSTPTVLPPIPPEKPPTSAPRPSGPGARPKILLICLPKRRCRGLLRARVPPRVFLPTEILRLEISFQ